MNVLFIWFPTESQQAEAKGLERKGPHCTQGDLQASPHVSMAEASGEGGCLLNTVFIPFTLRQPLFFNVKAMALQRRFLYFLRHSS